MAVIYKSIYMIDYEANLIDKRAVPDDFNQYIESLIIHINTNTSIRDFKPRFQTTQVIGSIREIITKTLSDKPDEEKLDFVHKMFSDVASRLLRTEVEKQVQISRMGGNVKRGSLIQALLMNEQSGEYTFLLAKVEHSGFFDDEDFTKKSGFSSEKNTIWKSCVMDCLVNEDDISIDSAKIYLDGTAKYWADDFLELDEMIDDEANTHNVFKQIEKVLLHNVKPKAPNDYFILRNAVVGYLKTPQHIDYNTMIDTILGGYQPTELEQTDLDKLKNRLCELPEKKKFDLQFDSIPSAINARIIKKVYPVNDGIEINIKDYVGVNTIQSIEEPGGKRFIKIRTNNEQTYKTFIIPN